MKKISDTEYHIRLNTDKGTINFNLNSDPELNPESHVVHGKMIEDFTNNGPSLNLFCQMLILNHNTAFSEFVKKYE